MAGGLRPFKSADVARGRAAPCDLAVLEARIGPEDSFGVVVALFAPHGF
jgi:hypothetical protein